jgi:signal peptidase II
MRSFWLTAGIIFLLDRITKYLILKSEFERIELLPILNVIKVWNKGVAFGIFSKTGATGSLILILITFIVLGVSYIWAKRIYSKNKEDKITLISLGMLFGGGMGNLADRILFGKVLDFIDLHIKTIHWPAFNVADIAITFSLFLLIYKNLKH